MRKKLFQDRITVGGSVDREVYERLGRLAEKAGITQSRLVANMVEVSVDYLETMDKLGVIAFARVFDEMRAKLRAEDHDGMAECL
jgi:predicted DNA-binding protein